MSRCCCCCYLGCYSAPLSPVIGGRERERDTHTYTLKWPLLEPPSHPAAFALSVPFRCPATTPLCSASAEPLPASAAALLCLLLCSPLFVSALSAPSGNSRGGDGEMGKGRGEGPCVAPLDGGASQALITSTTTRQREAYWQQKQSLDDQCRAFPCPSCREPFPPRRW